MSCLFPHWQSTAWFDNECVATPVVLPKNILQCTRSRLTVQCWWKTKKININILIAKGGGLEPLQPTPWLRLWQRWAHTEATRSSEQSTWWISKLSCQLLSCSRTFLLHRIMNRKLPKSLLRIAWNAEAHMQPRPVRILTNKDFVTGGYP